MDSLRLAICSSDDVLSFNWLVYCGFVRCFCALICFCFLIAFALCLNYDSVYWIQPSAAVSSGIFDHRSLQQTGASSCYVVDFPRWLQSYLGRLAQLTNWRSVLGYLGRKFIAATLASHHSYSIAAASGSSASCFLSKPASPRVHWYYFQHLLP